MALFTYFEPAGADAGVTMDQFSTALTTWVAMQDRLVTVEEAALAFNVSPDSALAAVDGAYWLFIIEQDGKRLIEMEGE